jgi:diguanylate cyclase (GGDEF)-like protein
MALAIENALKYQQAESSATTDYLTGLSNARSLFLQLDRELARCKRDNSSLTLMVCDMNGFKKINDRFGHLEGNRVLRLFAQALKDSCREYDYVARMGGDEFVVIAPGLAADDAAKRIGQIRPLARQAGFDVCGEDILSLSGGWPCLRKMAMTPSNFSPRPTAACMWRRKSSLRGKISGCMRGWTAGSPSSCILSRATDRSSAI